MKIKFLRLIYKTILKNKIQFWRNYISYKQSALI